MPYGCISPAVEADEPARRDRESKGVCMGGRQVLAARRLLAETLDGELPEHELVAAARSVVAELGTQDRLLELIADLASGEGDPEGCARLSYRHVLGFDKLLLIDGGPRHMLRAH